MSRKLLAFLLSELKIVRLICQGKRDGKPCGAVIEVPLDNLGSVFINGDNCRCKVCSEEFAVHDQGGNRHDAFKRLAEVVTAIKAVREHVEVEFVLPDTDS